MTVPEDTRSGGVPTPPPDSGVIPTPAEQALNAVLTAATTVEQLRAYNELREQLTDHRVAVYDGACGRVAPIGFWFSRCLRQRLGNGPHTADNQRWATADDMPYRKYPTVENCWIGGDS